MATVTYDGKKLIPAPLVNIAKTYNNTEDGHKVGSTFTVTLTGKLLSNRGSPATVGFSGGTSPESYFWILSGYPPDESDQGLEGILIKQEVIRHLFSQNGKSLEIQCGAATPMKCYPRVLNINFPEGLWVQYCDYSITLEAIEVFGLFDSEDYRDGEDYFVDSQGNKLYISNADESWTLETQEQPELFVSDYTYRLTHNINAVGKMAYTGDGLESPGWEQARDWVITRKGLDTNFVHSTSGLNLPAYYKSLNHIITENPSELNGSYTITETWVVASGDVIEDFKLSLNESLDKTTVDVNVEGSVQGLKTASLSKWDTALFKWNTLVAGGPTHEIFTRTQMYAGISLNTTPVQSTVSKNVAGGNIGYSYVYNDRPSNYITGARAESVTINDTKPTDVVGRVLVLGRAAGPVLQDMGTITETKRTLNIEIIMTPE